MSTAMQQLTFDYASLDSDTRAFVQEKTQAIHTRLKRTAEDIIAIGQDLIAVKERLQHGQFQPWLQSEFDMNYRSAVRFMHVAERFGESDNLSLLPVSVLYALAAPSTPDEVVEQVIEGQIPATLPAIQEAKQEVRQSALCKIYHCSVTDLSNHIEPDSIDFIITDPPYPKEFLSVYSDLAKFAAYALKPGGSLIAMVGHSYLPEIINTLREYLTYHWMLAYLTPGGQSAHLWQKNVNTFWKPILWYTKGKYTGEWIGDVCKSQVNDNDKRFHEWGQSESGMADIIDRFTVPDQLICDPFVGGGTTAFVAAKLKRPFVGCDIDEVCVQKTLQRVYGVLR